MNAVPNVKWSWAELDRFERDAHDSSADFANYLPPSDHAEYLDALTELARLDMELAARRGELRTSDDYFARFPQLAADSVAAAGVAHGYHQLHPDSASTPCPPAARSRRARTTADPDSFRTEVHQIAGSTGDTVPLPTVVLDDRPAAIAASVAHADDTPARPPTLPCVGDTVAGFCLTRELGKGAFGRVYQARQGDLAGRPVAVKVGTGLIGESHTLARLQHTNIVPIYSAHRHGPFQMVCMPYLGRITLAHLLMQLRTGGPIMPESARHLLDTFNQAAEATRPNRPASDADLPPTVATGSNVVPTAVPEPASDPTPPAHLHGGIWDRLTDGTVTEAVVWLTAQLAAGLAHAHERGIIHRDLKPANVLLTDDGVPMLLDFNLADDSNARNELASATVGGTLPYMAPEQLAAFSGKRSPMGARTDLYSLGVVLFELLTGVRPFQDRGGPVKALLTTMLTDRTAPLPSIRQWNPFVRPSLEALVSKLLTPDPNARYQSAVELLEDLNRYLERRPLRHAPNPSWRERARNWAVRHPRLMSSGTVGGVIGAVALVTLGTALVAREHTRTLESRLAFDDHARDLRGLQTLLDDRGLSRPRLNDALQQCETNLSRYGLRTDTDTPPTEWERHILVRYLSAEDRARLREQTAELYFLLGRAAFQRAKMTDDAAERAEAVATAERWNKQAEAFGGAALARAVTEQRADLYRLAGRTADAVRLSDANTVTPGSPRDRFLLGFWWYQRGLLRRALPELTAATADDPQNFSAWFVLGTTHLGVEQPDLAAMCFTACIALRSDFAPARLNRGLALMRLGKPRLAIDDFDVALRLDSKRAEPHYLRAGAIAQLGQHREAESGYTDALECDDCPPRVYLYRANSRDALKDEAGAKADRAEADRREPTDAIGWVARAENAADADPESALKHVNRALALSPFEVAALQLKAHLLSEQLNRPTEAIRVLDRALEHYPEHVPCLAGRAVMKARDKDRDGAVADAKAALLLDARGPNLYQIACVYSLTSRVQPADRFKAVELLHSAVRDGFGKEHLKDDPDLDPIRGTGEFKAIVASVSKE